MRTLNTDVVFDDFYLFLWRTCSEWFLVASDISMASNIVSLYFPDVDIRFKFAFDNIKLLFSN